MKNRFSLFRTVAAATLLTGLAPALAEAQQEVTPAPEASNDDETIVITARKKEESLQDAPIAVAAFGQEQLERLQINSIDDIGRFAPGLSFSKTFGRSTDRPVVRGQSNVLAGVQFGVESGAAYFVDGIYYPGSIQSLNLGDVARVEVIKGPQSALYGRNTYSGAINFVTKRAGQAFGMDASASAAEHGEYDLRASIDVPMGPTAGGRLSVRRYEYDGEFRNGVTGEDVGSESTTSLAGSFDWDITPDLSFRVRGSFNKDDDGPLPLFLQPATANNCYPGHRSLANVAVSGSTNRNQYFCGIIKPGQVFLNTGPRTQPLVTVPGVPNINGPVSQGSQPLYSAADGTAFDGIERETYLFAAQSSWDIGGSGYVLGLDVGVRNEDEKFGTDSDHSAVNYIVSSATNPAPGEALFANTTRKDISDVSVETRFSTPADNRLRGTIGGYYYYQELTGFDINQADPEGIFTKADYSITRNQAVFALVEADILENLTLTVEGRSAEESKTLRDNSPDGGPIAFARTVKFDSFTPRVTLAWRPTEDLSFYGIYSEGVKPGGLNGSIGVSVLKPTYEQEESKNWEIGAKGGLFEGRLNYTLAGYHIESTNVQLTTAVPPLAGSGATTSIVTNQGDGETYGVEFTADARVTDHLKMGLGYSWTRPEFTRGCDEDLWTLTSGGGLLNRGLTPGTNSSFDPITGVRLADGSLGTCSIVGKKYPLVPEHQASFNAEYRQPLGSGPELFIQGDVSYESTKYVQVDNFAETGDATIVGSRIGLDGDKWTLALFGRNLTDEDTITLATRWFQVPYGSPFAGNAYPVASPVGASASAPRAFFGGLRRGRTFGVELKVRY